MRFEDETLKGAIHKALGRELSQRDARRQCQDLSTRLGPIENHYNQLVESLQRIQGVLDQNDQERNPIMRQLALRTLDLVSGAKRIRSVFEVLNLIRRGIFGARLIRAIKDIFDYLQDVQDFVLEFKNLSQNLEEWERLQNMIIAVSRARGTVYQDMTELRDEIERLGCNNLQTTGPDVPMS